MRWASSMTATSQATRSTSATRIAANAWEQMTRPPVSNGFVRIPFRSAARTLSPSTTSASMPNFDWSSSRHWARSEAGTSTMARPFPSAASCASTSPASIVLPRPTSSARIAPPVGSEARANAAASIWCGLRSTAEWARAGTRREVPPPPRAVRASAAMRWWNPLSRARSPRARDAACITTPPIPRLPTRPSTGRPPGRSPGRPLGGPAGNRPIPPETVPASRSRVQSRGTFGDGFARKGSSAAPATAEEFVKFTCERCGKRFASVDEPAAGRVYRIRCRCGNVIHISAPHAEAEGSRGAGALPPIDRPRITGATRTPVPARAPTTAHAAPHAQAIGAGDATSRVHAPAPKPARVSDPAVPRRTVPAAAPPTPPVSHPLATPVSALGSEAPPPSWFEPTYESRVATPSPVALPARRSPLPAASDVTADVPLSTRSASPDPRPERTPPIGTARTQTRAVAPATPAAAPPPSFDPFAHAARAADPFDGVTPAVARAPLPPDPPAVPAPEHDDETSVELSVSEQYALPKPKRRKKVSLVAIAGTVVALGLVGATGVLVVKLRRGASPDPAAVAVRSPALSPVAPTPAVSA